MAVPRSAELANLEMRAHWSFAGSHPIVMPGSAEEDVALRRIDDLRDQDMAGMMPSHPDSSRGLSYGPYYRRGAKAEHLESRRSASMRYWKRRAL